MTDQQKSQPTTRALRTLREGAKKAAFSVLFTAILVIPKVRRLRRRIGAWAVVRLAAALAGCGLGWRYKHANGGTVDLVCGLGLFTFAVLVRAKPEPKSVDAQGRELGALVVLNGGTLIPETREQPARDVNVFVNPEWLFVLDGRERVVLEIPVPGVRELVVRPFTAEGGPGGEGQPWQLEIVWQAGGAHTATFRYEGFFAEHLAHVAETTLRNLLRKDLPVLNA